MDRSVTYFRCGNWSKLLCPADCNKEVNKLEPNTTQGLKIRPNNLLNYCEKCLSKHEKCFLFKKSWSFAGKCNFVIWSVVMETQMKSHHDRQSAFHSRPRSTGSREWSWCHAGASAESHSLIAHSTRCSAARAPKRPASTCPQLGKALGISSTTLAAAAPSQRLKISPKLDSNARRKEKRSE